MSLVKEVNANAAVAWSPLKYKSGMLALGVKGDDGVGFEQTGGEFKLVCMDLSDTSHEMRTLGSIKTPSRFSSLAWREVPRHRETCPYGVVAAGMTDGSVTLWNPKALIDGEDAATCQVSRIAKHKGNVNAIQFNPHEDSAHLFATGGSDGEVYIVSLEKLSAPGVFTPGGPANNQQQVNEITSVAWNTQVNYILATGAQNGAVVVWDLKQKKPWCEMRDPQRGMISALAWNPKEGLQLATASGDDHNPVIKLWDLRNSVSTPLAEFHDHSGGVLSLSWCPSDPGLLLSCGKDNRTLLWDLYSRQTVFEFPSGQPDVPSTSSDPFAFGASAGQRRWNVQWAAKEPAVASTCTLDGKIQVWGLSGHGTAGSRAPKWSRRPVGASFGFGGKLLVLGNPKEGAPNADRRRLVHLHHFASEGEMVQEAEALDQYLQQGDFMGHCERCITSAQTEEEVNEWTFMKILFEEQTRHHLLLYLGLDTDRINELNAKFCPSTEQTSEQDETGQMLQEAANDGGVGAEDVFASEAHADDSVGTSSLDTVSDMKSSLPPASEDTSERLEIASPPIYTRNSEDTLMQALLVGNFELAVNCCLHYNQLSDALLLASCGGPDLWYKTQKEFLARQKRPVMSIVGAIVTNDLQALVREAPVGDWRRTLAIFCSYAEPQEFQQLCDALGQRLEDAGDAHAATLCFMCAVNVDKCVGAWVKQMEVESNVMGHSRALHRLVEKVSIFSQAVGMAGQSLGDEVASHFAEYASLMAAQGRLDIAAKYAIYNDMSNMILQDRIFHANPVPGVQPPVFPFEKIDVQVTPPQQQQQQGYMGQNHFNAQPAPSYQQTAQSPTFGGNRFNASDAPAQQPFQSNNMQQRGYPPQPQPSYQAKPAARPPPQQPGSFNHPQPPAMHSQTPAPPQQTPPYPGQQSAFPGQQPPNPGQQNSQQQQQLLPGLQAQQPGRGFGGSTSSGPPPPNMKVAQSPSGYGAPPGPSPAISMSGSAPPMAQVPGVNTVQAAASYATSRISTQSGDMNARKKDGFVTSVGNKELTMKYGNHSNAPLSPMGATSAPQGAPPSAEEVAAIVQAFNDLVGQLQGLPLTMMEQKQMNEVVKSKDILAAKLGSGEVLTPVVGRLQQMVSCFSQRDFGTAQSIYMALSGSEWTQHKDWLRGLKQLIHISMKRFR